jgi:hypothetical protein
MFVLMRVREFCIAQVDATIGDLLGAAYAQVAFTGDSLQRASEMARLCFHTLLSIVCLYIYPSLTSFASVLMWCAQIQMIEAAMQENLETITWMDNITRAAALLKLSKVRNMIGYPPNPEYPSSPTAPSLPFPLCPLRAPFLSDVVACSNYTNLQLFPDQFYANVQNANTYAFVKMVNSVCIPLFDSPLSPPFVLIGGTYAAQVGQPADPNAWEMTADTINAYYVRIRFPRVASLSLFLSPQQHHYHHHLFLCGVCVCVMEAGSYEERNGIPRRHSPVPLLQ